MVATEEVRSVLLATGPLAYVLRRSPRAHRMRVTVDPARGVVVTVPTRRSWAPPVREIETFLRERERWLRRHLDRAAHRRAALAGRGPVGGGSIVQYLGEAHLVRVVRDSPAVRRSSVARVGADGADELVVSLAPADRRSLAAVLETWFRERARSSIEREIARHADALRVTPAAVTVRDQRSRWGSASRRGRLSFSWRLILGPPEALETVVVHELAHLRVFGHGPRFWSLVASRRPDHLRWRRWLHDHAWELHAALAPILEESDIAEAAPA